MFHDDKIIKETPFEIEEFKLDMSQEKASLTDLENIRRVYNNMRHLSESQASDERIWTAYTLDEFAEYMKYRWTTKNERDMENRYFFNYSIQRSLFRNGIARLWWIGKSTYDSKRTDPYELTAFVCKDQDFIENIFGRNFSNNPVIVKALISALIDAESEGLIVDRTKVRNITKYVNLLGGTYVLDCLSYDDVYSKIKTKLNF
ncbi:DUF6339 family protein [Clostridium sp. YIM B02551]|uniref:DUF6339 family protein n=1 Tax=Clostridium sp. YIM B02551 TaxID=2910679 RepID=UPI001EE9F1DC|nr:DUF6339 family protein [Clostridium sp. YIM B02551]